MSKGLEKYYVHKYNRVGEMFRDTTGYDILFVGSSRTHTTVFPRVIDSVTGKTSYNTGVDGGGMFDFKMTLDAYLAVHPAPSMVVMTIDPNSFNGDEVLFDPMQYFPVIKNNRVLDSTFSTLGYKTFVIKYLPWFSFIYLDDYSKNIAIDGFRGKKDLTPGEFENRGYRTNTNNCLDPSLHRKDSNLIKPNPALVKLFQSMLDTCKVRNIPVMLTFAPEYRHEFSGTFKNIEVFNHLIDSISNRNGLTFYRDDNLDFITDSCLFRDIKHVNTEGGIIYSRILGNRLKEKISSK